MGCTFYLVIFTTITGYTTEMWIMIAEYSKINYICCLHRSNTTNLFWVQNQESHLVLLLRAQVEQWNILNYSLPLCALLSQQCVVCLLGLCFQFPPIIYYLLLNLFWGEILGHKLLHLGQDVRFSFQWNTPRDLIFIIFSSAYQNYYPLIFHF